MSVTENNIEKNFNNNDHHGSYLHKKFKRMASTVAIFPSNNEGPKLLEANAKEIPSSSNISNESIATSHSELKKIKGRLEYKSLLKTYVQTICSVEDDTRLKDVNNSSQVSGQASFSDEFQHKTETIENDLTKETYNSGASGRHVCPYCKLSCAKPSVLQKHIRAHTNERPYPCLPCGFAFKTKSNLYKHRRSRTHALRLHGADVPAIINEEELSGESESETSVPTYNYANDHGFERRLEDSNLYEYSNREQVSDGSLCPSGLLNENRLKSIYKPKFRVASFSESEEINKLKRSLSQNAEFLNEHIAKIISDNEAIVDVIETPLQKKYNKIKQIAESKQFSIDGNDCKAEFSPLNLTKPTNEPDSQIRRKLQPESSSLTDLQKHPLNPEGSIIKDLLLKTKASAFTPEVADVDSIDNLYICNLCQIMYRSGDNLAIHKLYYCKGGLESGQINLVQKDKTAKPEFSKGISLNTCISESQVNDISNYDKSIASTVSSPVRNKPDNLIIMRNDCNDVATPLPSPGPLLGNTRLIDSRTTNELKKKTEVFKPSPSPKRKLESISEIHSPTMIDNISPRSVDLYPQPKFRCIEQKAALLRPIEDLPSHMRHNSASLQMFGGEVKIMDHSGSTTTLRIEPSKNQLSPIIIHQNISSTKCAQDAEASSVVVRSGLHSGGTIVHNPPTPKEKFGTPHQQLPKILISGSSMTPVRTRNQDVTHFQFPPFNAITAFNPLTLPPFPQMAPNGSTTIIHGGKLIPHVPGIPGPTSSNITLSPKIRKLNNVQNLSEDKLVLNSIISSESTCRRYSNASATDSEKDLEMRHNMVPIFKMKDIDEHYKHFFYLKSPSESQDSTTPRKDIDVVSKLPTQKDATYISNKAIITDKALPDRSIEVKTEPEIRNFNFEALITKAEIFSNKISCMPIIQKNSPGTSSMVVSDQRSETAYFQKNVSPKPGPTERKANFLRPSTLPLKLGTFTPKGHHGITPNANTVPLVSPETPRPAKAFGQLYLNGNAYTYLGLKCSTKVFYCTINRPQPTYVPNQHFLSMYSNWQLLSELTPDPLGLSAPSAMALYDSRHRPQSVTVARTKQDLVLTHSSQWNKHDRDKKILSSIDLNKTEEKSQLESVAAHKTELAGGFESNEEYTYVRGRGRGRYVCSECGIRCKKPSMLKKHIRTHTNVRPYTCVHCAFSFKTKGNLTKHMKSKSHYKKCCELGINPNEGTEAEGSEALGSGETDDETDSEGDELNEGETESSDTEFNRSRLPEHEAAHCLLSLGNTRPSTSTTPGLITSARPSTYPYTPINLEKLITVTEQDRMLTMRNTYAGETIEPDINEPMDLSKNDVKLNHTISEIPTARESSVLASLASNTAKLPQHQTQWVNGEPTLQATYLTERALFDSKIKQSQYTMSKLRKIELKESVFNERIAVGQFEKHEQSKLEPDTIPSETPGPVPETAVPLALKEENTLNNNFANTSLETKRSRTTSANTESVKNVVSEYLARINQISAQDNALPRSDNMNDNFLEEPPKKEQNNSGSESSKAVEHDPVARKVVIGAGGVAFKVSSVKDFDSSTGSSSRLLDDGRRVCDFCNKSFTKPSQLRLHLNIHYMERPFRCSACAVSFRTRGHLQKHERSGSHHNKVSMTSTFGAATSLNPRPFRCSDCNIAFRIHGHLAKHLRSKMHVMRLECLFKLPFGTFTEIERAGLSLTDIDTTDCESSLASLQSLARKLHEKDPSKFEYREPDSAGFINDPYLNKGSSEDEDEQISVISVDDNENIDQSMSDHVNSETRTIYSATDT